MMAPDEVWIILFHRSRHKLDRGKPHCSWRTSSDRHIKRGFFCGTFCPFLCVCLRLRCCLFEHVSECLAWRRSLLLSHNWDFFDDILKIIQKKGNSGLKIFHIFHIKWCISTYQQLKLRSEDWRKRMLCRDRPRQKTGLHPLGFD